MLHEFGTFGILVSATPLILGALRLARFNVQLVGFSKDHFTGMPIPLAALTLVSFVLYFRPDEIIASTMLQQSLAALTVACGVLMISTIRYPVIPKISLGAFRAQPLRMGVFTVAALVVVGSAGKLLFPVLLTLGISGQLAAAGRKLRRLSKRSSGREGEEEQHQESVYVDSQS